jgi:hypothetical protein
MHRTWTRILHLLLVMMIYIIVQYHMVFRLKRLQDAQQIATLRCAVSESNLIL